MPCLLRSLACATKIAIVAVLTLTAADAFAFGQKITDVRVRDNVRTNEDTIRATAGIAIGDTLETDTLEKVRERLNNSGLFADINVFWEPHNEGARVVITVREKFPWAPVPTFSKSPGQISFGAILVHGNLFGRGKQGVMYGILKSGYRAVSVAVNQTSGAAGFILPGDYVDVMLTHDKLKEVVRTRVPKDRKLPLTVLQTATETVLQKVRVLAIAQNVGETEKQAVVVPTVTLELSPKQAQIITTARSMGRLSLVLRSLEGASDKEAPRSFTTDVEVSTFMQNFDEIIQRTSVPADSKGPTQAEKDRDRLQKELEEMQKELAAAKVEVPKTPQIERDLAEAEEHTPRQVLMVSMAEAEKALAARLMVIDS